MLSSPGDILSRYTHRPYPYPEGPWILYQGWRKLIFLHWPLAPEELQRFLPTGLKPDIHDGWAWISVVAFTVVNMHPRFLPSLPFFHEINHRTYVTDGKMPGISFLDIYANNKWAVWLNQSIGLPYKTHVITRKKEASDHNIYCNAERRRLVEIGYNFNENTIQKSELDRWLTERYCAYQQAHGSVYRFPVHHQEWKLQPAIVNDLQLRFPNHPIMALQEPPALIHYAGGVNVLSWMREKLT